MESADGLAGCSLAGVLLVSGVADLSVAFASSENIHAWLFLNFCQASADMSWVPWPFMESQWLPSAIVRGENNIIEVTATNDIIFAFIQLISNRNPGTRIVLLIEFYGAAVKSINVVPLKIRMISGIAALFLKNRL